MKTPDAHTQVSALLDLIPEPRDQVFVGIDPAFPGTDESVSVIIHPDGTVEPTFGTDELEAAHTQALHGFAPSALPVEPFGDTPSSRNVQRTVTAHTVALISVLGSLGDAHLGRRTFDQPDPTPYPPRPPNQRDVFGSPLTPTSAPSYNRPTDQTDADAISKAEAKRARRAARKR